MIKVNKVSKNQYFKGKKGKFITIIRQSDGDKSAFLYSLELLSKPTSGRLYLNGNKI